MIRFSSVWNLAKKEWRALFDAPTAYIVLAVILLLWEFLFFRNVFLIGEASLRSLFDTLPWLGLILASAITMGSFAEERSSGTLELLFTHPIKEQEIVAGKWLGAWLFASAGMTVIFPLALSLSAFGSFEWGVIVAQYLASILFLAPMVALGVTVSSFFKHQISSILVTIALGFFLIIAGFEFVTQLIPLTLAPILEFLSPTSHLYNMGRGVIDVRDAWYTLAATLIPLTIAWLSLRRRRAGIAAWQQVRGAATAVMVCAALVGSTLIATRIPGRLDLTSNGKFTITEGTRRVLQGLGEPVTLTLYASPKLPAQLQPALRDIRDTLADYARIGGDRIRVETKDPTRPDIEAEAKERGIQPVQFNVIGRGEFQVQHGFLGIALSQGSSTKALPFVPQTDALEYQLTSQLHALTVKEKPVIRFLTGSGEQSFQGSFAQVSEALETQFQLEELLMASGTPMVPTGTAVLVTAAPTEDLSTSTRDAILSYVRDGGSLLVLYEGSDVNPVSMIATPLPRPRELLSMVGITPEEGIAFDVNANETVRVGGAGAGYVLPYAFWPRVQVLSGAPAANAIQTVVLPWATAFALDPARVDAAGFTANRILATTPAGGRQVGSANVAPNERPTSEQTGAQSLGWHLTAKEPGANGRRGQIIVLGSASFASDMFVGNAPENLVFLAESMSHLAAEESLAALASKQTVSRRLLVERDIQVTIVTYGNMIGVLLALGGIGGYRYFRRRRLASVPYRVTAKT